jgi:arylsulfatase A-like enzyme
MNGGGPGAHGFDVHDGATGNTEGQDGMPDPKRTGAITDSALAFLDQRGVDRRPFFLQVSYYAVHNPTRATPAAIREWEARPPGRVHRNAEYAAMTEALDASVGAVLDRLHALALDETTYVIYTSDNGGETMNDTTSNAPLARSKTSVWEGGIRVPLIVRGPDIAAGVSSRVPVIGWDLMPTIAQWVGAEDTLASDLDGGSLTDILRGGNTVRRPGDEFVWFYPHYRNMKGVTPQAAIRDGRYKLIVEYESGRRWLFDLEADVGETTDLSVSHPEIAQRLAARLDGYLDGVGAKRPGVNANYDPARDPALRGVSVGTGRSGS